jgi:hypothetical protein
LFKTISSIFWAVFGGSTWSLLDYDFNSNFLINVFTYDTCWLLPSCDVVSDTIEIKWC